MKSMWTAASGMKSLQLQIDTISNNLANVNTTGFKTQRVEFQDLLYEKIDQSTFVDGEGKPAPIEVGHGVMPVSTVKSFSTGSMLQTTNELDFAIDGNGFFVVNNEKGEEVYTRDGSFKLSITDGSARLATSDGYLLQGEDGEIDLGENVERIEVGKNGSVMVKRSDSEELEEVGVLKLVNFVNASGLESLGQNSYKSTVASGEPIDNDEGSAGEVWQGFLEASNVSVVEEMVSMISAQRAYEINSKSIQTADRMLEIANGLKR